MADDQNPGLSSHEMAQLKLLLDKAGEGAKEIIKPYLPARAGRGLSEHSKKFREMKDEIQAAKQKYWDWCTENDEEPRIKPREIFEPTNAQIAEVTMVLKGHAGKKMSAQDIQAELDDDSELEGALQIYESAKRVLNVQTEPGGPTDTAYRKTYFFLPETSGSKKKK